MSHLIKIILCLLPLALSNVLMVDAQTPYFRENSSECGITVVGDITDLYGNGAATADFDNDGDIDFYLTTDAGIHDRLYKNDGQGRFIDIALESGINEILANRAALWFDYNGDHRLDLLVVGENCVNRSCQDPIHLSLYRQMEDLTFREVSKDAGLILGSEFDNLPIYAVGGMAAADLDQDHYLDLIFTIWGAGIKLFHNNGDDTFIDQTFASGLNHEETMYWQPLLYDFNQDGLIDIYCNVDFAPNQLWINRGNVFEEQAIQYDLDHAFNEMGITMTDYDNDGDLDIYATNITRDYQGQNQFNILLEQKEVNGRIVFVESAKSLGVSQSGWDWGAAFIDINNDGWQDLATTNGWNDVFWNPDQSRLWLNTSIGFVDISNHCGFNDVFSATTLLAFDKDRDGDLDLLQTLKDNPSTKKPLLIYENRLEELANHGNYITIKPRMPGPNYYAIGSIVTIKAEDLISSRLISAGTSFYGQEPAEAFFGLGKLTEIKEIIVKWPTNEISIYQNIPVNEVNILQYEIIAAPNNLVSIFQNGQIVISWQDQSDNETGFVLQRANNEIFNDFKEILLGKDTTSYRDEEIESNTKYFYKVRAFNPDVLSEDSNISSIQTGEEGNVTSTEILVYPNPAFTGWLNVRISAPYKGPINARLLDLSAKEIWSKDSYKSISLENLKIELNVPEGLYILCIKMGNKESWHKVHRSYNK